MKLALLAVGRLKNRHLDALCGDYAARIRRLRPLEVVEVRDHQRRARDAADAVRREGEALLARVQPTDRVVAMDVTGRTRSSEELSAHLERLTVGGTRRMAFAVGGPYGLSEAVLARADERLSLSPMTFPHELARTILLEQLYRALAIARNLPYHHGD